jgi:hypothetical protein
MPAIHSRVAGGARNITTPNTAIAASSPTGFTGTGLSAVACATRPTRSSGPANSTCNAYLVNGVTEPPDNPSTKEGLQEVQQFRAEVSNPGRLKARKYYKQGSE